MSQEHIENNQFYISRINIADILLKNTIIQKEDFLCVFYLNGVLDDVNTMSKAQSTFFIKPNDDLQIQIQYKYDEKIHILGKSDIPMEIIFTQNCQQIDVTHTNLQVGDVIVKLDIVSYVIQIKDSIIQECEHKQTIQGNQDNSSDIYLDIMKVQDSFTDKLKNIQYIISSFLNMKSQESRKMKILKLKEISELLIRKVFDLKLLDCSKCLDTQIRLVGDNIKHIFQYLNEINQKTLTYDIKVSQSSPQKNISNRSGDSRSPMSRANKQRTPIKHYPVFYEEIIQETAIKNKIQNPELEERKIKAIANSYEIQIKLLVDQISDLQQKNINQSNKLNNLKLKVFEYENDHITFMNLIENQLDNIERAKGSLRLQSSLVIFDELLRSQQNLILYNQNNNTSEKYKPKPQIWTDNDKIREKYNNLLINKRLYSVTSERENVPARVPIPLNDSDFVNKVNNIDKQIVDFLQRTQKKNEKSTSEQHTYFGIQNNILDGEGDSMFEQFEQKQFYSPPQISNIDKSGSQPSITQILKVEPLQEWEKHNLELVRILKERQRLMNQLKDQIVYKQNNI